MKASVLIRELGQSGSSYQLVDTTILKTFQPPKEKILEFYLIGDGLLLRPSILDTRVSKAAVHDRGTASGKGRVNIGNISFVRVELREIFAAALKADETTKFCYSEHLPVVVEKYTQTLSKFSSVTLFLSSFSSVARHIMDMSIAGPTQSPSSSSSSPSPSTSVQTPSLAPSPSPSLSSSFFASAASPPAAMAAMSADITTITSLEDATWIHFVINPIAEGLQSGGAHIKIGIAKGDGSLLQTPSGKYPWVGYVALSEGEVKPVNSETEFVEAIEAKLSEAFASLLI